MRNVFRPNQLIELELNTADQNGQKECYASRIEEVHPQYLLVAAPIKNGHLVPIAPGDCIALRLHFQGALYSALCQVQARRSQGVAMLKISRPEEVSRIQQRSWVRIEILLPVEYRMAGYPIDYYKGLTLDLSGGGILMVTSHPIDVDTLLDLRIPIQEDFILECIGRVIRCNRDGADKQRHKIGIKFEELDEPTIQRIISFIFQKQRESIKKGNLKQP